MLGRNKFTQEIKNITYYSHPYSYPTLIEVGQMLGLEIITKEEARAILRIEYLLDQSLFYLSNKEKK